jgi:polysaccharide export outer membrane protein
MPLKFAHNSLILYASIVACLLCSTHASAADPASARAYLLQPGDVLGVSVWKEEELSREVIIRPDGKINFPLVGEAQASGDSVETLRALIAEKLKRYIPDPVVTVSVRQFAGNLVYVIGKVNRPGVFSIPREVDVMQALSMAGGTSTYAALNKIRILRRENGELRAIRFHYGEVEKGEDLEQNIILKPGDVVVVP